jgi:hypothetical protein
VLNWGGTGWSVGPATGAAGLGTAEITALLVVCRLRPRLSRARRRRERLSARTYRPGGCTRESVSADTCGGRECRYCGPGAGDALGRPRGANGGTEKVAENCIAFHEPGPLLGDTRCAVCYARREGTIRYPPERRERSQVGHVWSLEAPSVGRWVAGLPSGGSVASFDWLSSDSATVAADQQIGRWARAAIGGLRGIWEEHVARERQIGGCATDPR